MGKDLKGKECGKGICQRKDGFYTARFIARCGKRQEKYFKSINDAKKWLEEVRYLDKHGQFSASSDMTVTEWFDFWEANIKCDLSPNTRRNYRDRFKRNIQPVIGNIKIGEPNKNSSYDTHFYKLCDEAHIERFCMHALRRTYATRAIEAGVQPKVLQKLPDHSSIQTTMDRYVHVTDESMQKAIELFEQNRAGQIGVEMV